MTTEILRTKLYLPSAHAALVVRPRITERLSVGLACKLILIAAPAGFGKTTAASAWIDPQAETDRMYPFVRRPAQSAWVSLDANDNDPPRFWRYVITALDALAPGLAETSLSQLNAPQPPIDAILTRVLNTLAALPDDAVLVLDDYHVITKPVIHDGITFLLDHLPLRLHLVITCRSEPPLPLARLRVRGQLTELHAADLRFTPDEAAAFLREVMGLPLDSEVVAALEARTEGWIAGLQLAALAMRDRRDLVGFLSAFTGSNRLVMDYLVEEVVARQPTHIQEFLLRTSILDRMCGSLCDAVLLGGTEHQEVSITTDSDAYSQLMLQELERRNLFLVALDDERRWYRYHHLFGEGLRARLRGGAGSAEIRALHQRASGWHEQHGLMNEAIQHALTAQDWERGAKLIAQHGTGIMLRGQVHTVLGWLNTLPDAFVRSQAVLCTTHAGALMHTNQLEASQARLDAAEQCIHADTPAEQVQTIRGYVAMLRANIAYLIGDIRRSIMLAQQALALLDPADIVARSTALMLEVRVYLLTGDVTSTSAAMVERAVEVARASGNLFTLTNTIISLMHIRMLQGRLRAAATIYRDVIPATESSERQFFTESVGYCLFMGDLLRKQNNLDMAEHLLSQGIATIRTSVAVSASVVTTGYIALAQLQQARGQAYNAMDTLETFMQVAHQKAFVPDLLHRAQTVQARLWLQQQNITAAVRWASAIQLQPDDLYNFSREVEYLTLVRVWIAQSHSADALALLARLHVAADERARIDSVIEIQILQVLAHQALGQPTEALIVLEHTLALAAPEGYVRVFVDEGPTMRELLHQMAGRTSQLSTYIATLLAAFPGAPEASRVPTPAIQPPSRTSIDALNERELEVLRLIATGRSNREIADTLVIALSTVKTHINNCYGKLGVHSRTQAIARAHELGLI